MMNKKKKKKKKRNFLLNHDVEEFQTRQCFIPFYSFFLLFRKKSFVKRLIRRWLVQVWLDYHVLVSGYDRI